MSDQRFKNDDAIMTLDMPPLVEVNPDGIEMLMRAVMAQAGKDYSRAKRFLKTAKPNHRCYKKALETVEECRLLLGEEFCIGLDWHVDRGFHELGGYYVGKL